MTAAGDDQLDVVRAHLAAIRRDAESEAATAQLGHDLARIRADLQRLAEAHAAAWQAMEPLSRPAAAAQPADRPSAG
jgi:hypothetical protein